MKRIIRPMLGFKSFGSARRTLRGIELMHMIKKGQMILADGKALSAADQFYALAASLRLLEAGCADQGINATESRRPHARPSSGLRHPVRAGRL
mgnify:CR=1 FL=1